MEKRMIINKTTQVKRRIYQFFERILTFIHKYRINCQAKKIIAKLRKKYIKSGDIEQAIREYDYKFELAEPLQQLKEQNLIDYTQKGRCYRITIKE